ncbi:MAG TPA: prepilin-type N-terminal cleavage/methylation domain-containing protein [Acidiferrobacteraceae bacterium]|nr:prepilin-type N-terminal cleavage/methylation domain-containing protein [Acidiferrobacteraceae bacterium]
MEPLGLYTRRGNGTYHTACKAADSKRLSRPLGYTLIEMAFTLSIASILLAIAAPDFRDAILSARLSANMNELVHDLHLARTLAISNAEVITVCQSRDGRQCGSTPQWEVGWLVFKDPNVNRKVDEDETIVRQHDALSTGLDIRFRAFGSSRNLSYYPTGWTWNRNGTFTFCDDRGASKARAIILHRTGRVRTSHLKAGGDALTCPPG